MVAKKVADKKKRRRKRKWPTWSWTWWWTWRWTRCFCSSLLFWYCISVALHHLLVLYWFGIVVLCQIGNMVICVQRTILPLSESPHCHSLFSAGARLHQITGDCFMHYTHCGILCIYRVNIYVPMWYNTVPGSGCLDGSDIGLYVYFSLADWTINTPPTPADLSYHKRNTMGERKIHI